MKHALATLAAGLITATLLLPGCAADGSSGGVAKPQPIDITQEMKKEQ